MKTTKTRNLEKFGKYAMRRSELKKIKGGNWEFIDGEWVWVDNK